MYTVYVRVNENGIITNINSDMFIKDFSGWIPIESGNGYNFMHAQNNYLSKPLRDERGICRYKLQDGALVERTAEEMETDVKPAEKSALEKRLERVETALNTITELLAKLGMK